MPKYHSNVRPETSPPLPTSEKSTRRMSNRIDTFEVSPQPDSPYPAADGAGDGASKGYKPTLTRTMGSNNVPQPDNKGPVKASSGDGNDGMAG